jgi:kynureninase
MDLTTRRAQFPILDRFLYFNACSLGPLPRTGMEALGDYIRSWDERGTPVWFDSWMPALERLRDRVAELLRAPAGSTALAPSATVALATTASALLRSTPRRQVLVGELDFPTLGHQFLSRSGVDVEFVPSGDGVSVSPAAFGERIDGGTALVATTHLVYSTGALQDVRALADVAHANGALLLVDGYHAVGCTPVDVRELDCDVYVGGCLKWLSGGPGTAFLYCRPELAYRLEPEGIGWMATEDPLSFSLTSVRYAAQARRFETGTWAVPCHYAALAGIELVLDVGVERICARLREMTTRIQERCRKAGLATRTPADPARRCGIVSVECARPDRVERSLAAADMIVDVRPGLLRLSPHWALSDDEIERGMDLVERAL